MQTKYNPLNVGVRKTILQSRKCQFTTKIKVIKVIKVIADFYYFHILNRMFSNIVVTKKYFFFHFNIKLNYFNQVI